jgi:hypothetical protein
LALELWARHLRELGQSSRADESLGAAIDCYRRWGADGHARALKQQLREAQSL